MKKLIIVCPLYPEFGGLETHVREIVSRLSSKFDIEIVCTDPWNTYKKSEITTGNIKVTRFVCFAPNNAFFFCPEIKTYLDNTPADIIHVHGYNALPSYIASFTKNPAKFVYTPHYHHGGHTFIRNLLHIPYRIMSQRVFNKASKIICVSHYEKKILLSDFKIPSSKISYIPNGINISDFNSTSPKFPNKTILYVGRLEKYKNVDKILEALVYLKDYHLQIVGKGPQEQELNKKAIDLNILKRVHFHRYLHRLNLLEYYAKSNVFAMLSDHEAFSIVTAEALASGTDCIVTERLMKEDYIDPEHCIGVNPENIQEIIDAVKKLEENPIKAKYFGKDWNEVAIQTEKLYEELLEI